MRLTSTPATCIVSLMENEIKVGSVVFHRNPISSDFKGPGTVVRIVKDADLGVDAYMVSWQSSGVLMDHYRPTLLTLAEKESQ